MRRRSLPCLPAMLALMLVGMACGMAAARDLALTADGAAAASEELDVQCPCDPAYWRSHNEYVRCARDAAKAQRGRGPWSRRDLRQAVRTAHRSTCGEPDVTRCCVYRSLGASVSVGRCRRMTPEACAELSAGGEARMVEDVGGGRCDPNPCIF